jgi:hypothetical protein
MMPTTETLSNGEIVVPMSTLLDALQGVLDPGEKTALFAQLLNLRPKRVAPGDLIRADQFNQILDDINDLMLRVAMLEGNADTSQVPPRIDSITPQVVHSGDQIVVSGAGLSALNMQTIRFDSTQVPVAAIKDGSTSQRMVIDTPPLLGLPTNGKAVILFVENGAGDAQGSYTQLPGEASFGVFDPRAIITKVEPVEALVPNKTYTVTLQSAIKSTKDEIFDVTGNVDGAGFSTGAANPASITVTPDSEDDPVVTTIRIPVTTGVSGSSNFSLILRGKTFANAVGGLASPLKLEVGRIPNIDSAKILFGSVWLAGGTHTVNTTGAVPVITAVMNAAGTTVGVLLHLPIEMVDGGEIKVSGLSVTNGTGWTLGTPVIAPNPVAAGGAADVAIALTPTKASGRFTAQPATLTFNVTNVTGSQSRTYTAALRVQNPTP